MWNHTKPRHTGWVEVSHANHVQSYVTGLSSFRAKTMLSAHGLLREWLLVLVCISPESGNRLRKPIFIIVWTTIVYIVGQQQRQRSKSLVPVGFKPKLQTFCHHFTWLHNFYRCECDLIYICMPFFCKGQAHFLSQHFNVHGRDVSSSLSWLLLLSCATG